MALYLISYDINEKDDFEYDGLWAALKQLGAVRILYSEWLITAEQGSAHAIYSKVATKTQEKDRLWVQEVADDAYWDKLMISDEAFQDLLTLAKN